MATLNLNDKPSTLAVIGNLSLLDKPTMVDALGKAHRMILARKGRQKAELGGETVKDLRAALDTASRALADCPPGDPSHANVYAGWKACHDKLAARADAQEGLEYHYLETFRDACKAVLLATHRTAVTLKGDGNVATRTV